MTTLGSRQGLLEFDGSPLYVSAEEISKLSFDFDTLIEDTETIFSVTIKVYTLPRNEDVSSDIKLGSESISGTTVIQSFSSYVVGTSYRVEVKAVIYEGGVAANKVLENFCTIHCAM